jgi:hypothetical protein
MSRVRSAAMVTLLAALALHTVSAQTPAAPPSPATAPTSVPGAATVPASAPAQADESKDPRALLKRLPPGSKLEDLHPSPIPGIYEFAQGADVSYLTATASFSSTATSTTWTPARTSPRRCARRRASL